MEDQSPLSTPDLHPKTHLFTFILDLQTRNCGVSPQSIHFNPTRATFIQSHFFYYIYGTFKSLQKSVYNLFLLFKHKFPSCIVLSYTVSRLCRVPPSLLTALYQAADIPLSLLSAPLSFPSLTDLTNTCFFQSDTD